MRKKITQINIVINRDKSSFILDILKGMNINKISMEPGRSIIIKERKGILGVLLGDKMFIDYQVENIRFLISPDSEKAVMTNIIEKAGFDIPGTGTIYSKEIEIATAHPEYIENIVAVKEVLKKNVFTDLLGISCIVQKGEGEKLGEVGLNIGAGIPAISYGSGTGLRNRLGLWRITIPAQKEIIDLITTSHDAENLLDMMITIGSLDQPGKGFIYLFPVKTGITNTKYFLGMTHQAASIEQIVATIDNLVGDVGWRRRNLTGSLGKKPSYLSNLVSFDLICNEGSVDELTKIAMDAGAAGATIRKLKYIDWGTDKKGCISPAREISTMIVSNSQINALIEALEKNDVFNDSMAGVIEIGPVIKACTYLGKN